MTLRDAAREVVATYAEWGIVSGRGGIEQIGVSIDALQRELAMTADRDALSTEIHARRQTDSVEKMQAFRDEFWRLANEWGYLGSHVKDDKITPSFIAARDALSRHLFGDVQS